MAKLNLQEIASLANTASAKQALNENFSDLAEAIDNTLSRDGTLPNQMEADLDMNSHDLLNVRSIDAQEYLLNGIPLAQEVAYGTKHFDLFSGNDVDTSFPLSIDPGSLANLEVSISGVMQRPGLDYTYSGLTLIFAEPPIQGDDNILVRYDEALMVGTSDASGIGFTQVGIGAVPNTLEKKEQEVITPQDYGAVGNSVHDDTAAFNAMATAARSFGKRVVIPQTLGEYRLTSTVNLRGIAIDGLGSQILIDHEDIGLVLGGNGPLLINPDQMLGYVTRTSGLTATPTVQIRGTRFSRTTIMRAEYIQLYADTSPGIRNTDYSIAYSSFRFDWVDFLEITNNPANTIPDSGAEGGAIQWINENVFYLRACHDVFIGGTYRHNHNFFYHGTFEGDSSIIIERGNNNKFYGMRFEGGPTTITFEAETHSNTIINTWNSSEVGGWPNNPLITGTITDNGEYGNAVLDENQLMWKPTTVAYADATDIVLNPSASGTPLRDSDLNRVASTQVADICISEYLPVEKDVYFGFFWDEADSGDTVLYRPFFDFYTESLLPVADATGYLSSSIYTSVIGGNRVSCSTGIVSGTYTRFTPAAISAARFVRVGVRISGGQTANALARRVYAVAWAKNDTAGALEVKRPDFLGARPYVVTGIPTQGYAPVGYQAIRQNGANRYYNLFAHNTNITSSVAGGAGSVNVADPTGIAIGDVIGINLDNRGTHWTTVSNVAGSVISLTANMPSAAASGRRAAFNRWKTETLTLA